MPASFSHYTYINNMEAIIIVRICGNVLPHYAQFLFYCLIFGQVLGCIGISIISLLTTIDYAKNNTNINGVSMHVCIIDDFKSEMVIGDGSIN